MSEYMEAVNEVRRLHVRKEEMQERHAGEMFRINGALAEAEQQVQAIESGISAEDWKVARTLIMVHGDLARALQYSDGRAAVESAKASIRSGGAQLQKIAFGVKQYEGWSAQRCDCEYGYGPKHGSVWFSVRATPAFRRRAKLLTDDEILACTRWLTTLTNNPQLLTQGSDKG